MSDQAVWRDGSQSRTLSGATLEILKYPKNENSSPTLKGASSEEFWHILVIANKSGTDTAVFLNNEGRVEFRMPRNVRAQAEDVNNCKMRGLFHHIYKTLIADK